MHCVEMDNTIALKQSRLGYWIRTTIGPLLLILLCPPAAMLMWHINVVNDGSLQNFISQGLQIPLLFGSLIAWKIIAVFAATQLIFMRIIPGKTFRGPITPKGNIPIYQANGIPCFLLTILLFYLCSFKWNLFSPTIVYDNFGELIGALNIFSLLFCFLLYIKGRKAPSTTDCGVSGNPIFDYYWGIELYPKVMGWNLKMFTNCRFGMMGWGVIILSFAAKQSQLYGLSDSMFVAVALQLLYIFKFFIWETGYLRSLDIMHDRAGFYICWGCLVWVPAVYTSPILYLVNHPNNLGIFAYLIFALGVGSILINYLADRQRQFVRSTNGNCTVWGKKPTLITAHYTTQDGEKRQNILLASGWWGIARHFHYVPEILGALFWTLPALFTNALPYFYVLFLTILLIDRTVRDEKRCALKYGPDWLTYSQKVKYKIIPYVY